MYQVHWERAALEELTATAKSEWVRVADSTALAAPSTILG